MPADGRDFETRRAQFELERELRQRILNSSKADRARVTAEAYGELFDKFQTHGACSDDASIRVDEGAKKAAMIAPFAHPPARVLEVGCGRADVLAVLAREGFECVGLESSEHMVEKCQALPNVKVVFGLADKLPFDDASFQVVFSQQVLEHLHPDDVPDTFREAYRVLLPGGILAIETPNRRTGPQDISAGFTEDAEGLHLKEWTVREMAAEFRRAGFCDVCGLFAPPFIVRRWRWLHRASWVGSGLRSLQDSLLGLVPHKKARRFAAKLTGLNDVFLFARKPAGA